MGAIETWREEMDEQPSHEVRHAAYHEDRTVLLAVRIENTPDRSLKDDAPHCTGERTDADHRTDCGARNMSLGSVNTLAIQPWWAAAATATMSTAAHWLGACVTNAVGTMMHAMSSMAVFRAPLTDQPRASSLLDSQPPATDPTSAMTYTTMSGRASPASFTPYLASRNFGSQ